MILIMVPAGSKADSIRICGRIEKATPKTIVLYIPQETCRGKHYYRRPAGVAFPAGGKVCFSILSAEECMDSRILFKVKFEIFAPRKEKE
ncbi:MAG TPA: hypothetical protein ENJ40_07215 [Thermosulfurimonas dismutans]|uniref:Uncharacterized protein n=1 Tax=Thermosulfurimonas dismutans TaxID=999894 RepID=A0A7C3CYW5_9BACT|nr:hypothetical protein [Thermosulfurimonas dismutans]